jgi:hypothetical protein
LEEGTRFELVEVLSSDAFQTSALNHSANPEERKPLFRVGRAKLRLVSAAASGKSAFGCGAESCAVSERRHPLVGVKDACELARALRLQPPNGLLDFDTDFLLSRRYLFRWENKQRGTTKGPPPQPQPSRLAAG